MASARHLLLKRRVQALKKHLLPKHASLTGDYSRRQIDGIAGYLVLAHAELEHYFEEKALELVDLSFSSWLGKKSVSRPLLCMVTYYAGERKGPPQSFDVNQFKDRNIDTLIGNAVNQHKSRITGNNGIRENDICDILFPIGFSYNDLSTTLVASLSSFGKRRGSFAHQSTPKAISANQIDPFVEAKMVEDIVDELVLVDKQFSDLRAPIR